MAHVLGVDAGGSKTHALVAQKTGALVGFGQAGCGNYEGVGLPAAMQAVAGASLQACTQAGVKPSEIEVGCFCLAGADFPEDFIMLQEAVEQLRLARKVVIKNDTYAALRAGTRREYGVVVIMGSGFNAAAVDPTGREHRLAGEGYLYGDWGGAGDIGAEVMHRVARAYDGRGRPTMLTEMALRFFGAPDVRELLLRLNRGELGNRRIHEATPLVFEAAYSGDEVACEILRKIGNEAAASAIAMMRRGGMERFEVDIVLGGGVFKGEGPLLLDTVVAAVHAVNPLAHVVIPRYLPVVGAAVAAVEATGASAAEQVWDNLESSYEKVVSNNGRRDCG
jgi:N-acetylglucosamine kinase-like BadF-type ATPase